MPRHLASGARSTRSAPKSARCRGNLRENRNKSSFTNRYALATLTNEERKVRRRRLGKPAERDIVWLVCLRHNLATLHRGIVGAVGGSDGEQPSHRNVATSCAAVPPRVPSSARCGVFWSCAPVVARAPISDPAPSPSRLALCHDSATHLRCRRRCAAGGSTPRSVRSQQYTCVPLF